MLISIDLTEQETIALSQLVKRLQWDHIRQCAANDDEAHMIRDAVDALRRELAATGYNPR